MNKSIGNMQN